jgi:hypothetical protein
MMGPLKIPLNFKQKVLIGCRFPTSPPKPSALESPLLETLNDPHSHSNIPLSNDLSITRKWFVHECEV